MSSTAASTNIKPESSDERFRPAQWLWLPTILYVLVQGYLIGSIYFLEEPHEISAWGIAVFLATVVLPAIALSLPLFREIRIDADRLSWRTWRGWQSVAWSKISDYDWMVVLLRDEHHDRQSRHDAADAVRQQAHPMV